MKSTTGRYTVKYASLPLPVRNGMYRVYQYNESDSPMFVVLPLVSSKEQSKKLAKELRAIAKGLEKEGWE